MRREQFREDGWIRSGRRVGHADDLHAMGAQQGLEIEVAGIVHHDRVAGLQQVAADQVDRLRARGGEEDLVCPGFDPLACELAHQKPAQRERATGVAVVREDRVVGLREAADCAANGGIRHPVGRQPAASRLEHFGVGIERLARHPERINGAVAPRLDLGQRKRRRGAGDVEAGAPAGTGSRLRAASRS